MVLAVLHMVDLVEVAEGVPEPSDHLRTHPTARGPSAAARQARGPKIGEKCNLGVGLLPSFKNFLGA